MNRPLVIAQAERIVLRREAPGDLEAWLEHLNTPEVTAHLGGPRTPEEVAEKFARMARDWEAHGHSFMIVALRESDMLIGTCGIGPIDVECAPEALRAAVQIGWTLRADHWGQGYAQEAAQAAMAFAFEQRGVEILYSQTSGSNRPSWRLMEKLGMQRRADLDYDDPHYPAADNPTIIYAIDRETWRAQADGAVRVA